VNRSRLAALSAGAMFLVASVIAPAVATADSGGTNTVKVLNAPTINPPATGGSFTVNIVANGSVLISGAGAGLSFDNTKLTLTAVAKDAIESANGVSYLGFPNAAGMAAFIAAANTGGANPGQIPNISWSYLDGSSTETANADHGIFSATFSVAALGDSTLTPNAGPTILDGTPATYGSGLNPITPVAGTVVNHSAPVFSISAAPGAVSVNRGGNTNATPITVHTATTSGTPGSVNLTATGLPTGVTAAFAPTSVDPNVVANQDSSLTFSANATATTGLVTVTIHGVDSSDATDAHTTTIQLTVVAPNDYSIAATPPSVTISAGGAAGSTSISVAQLQPTVGTVNLSVTSPAITGVTIDFGAAHTATGSATVGTPATLNISATAAAAPGPYLIVVHGDNGFNTHDVNVSLTINGAAAPNQQDVSVSGTMDGGFIAITCPQSVAIPLLRGNTNDANVSCAVSTNTNWALNVNDAVSDTWTGYMTTGRPVDNTTKFQLADSMHVLANQFIDVAGNAAYHNDVNLVAGGTILTGTNSANAPLVLRQFVRASTHPGSYSIQLTFAALNTF
jgi:hypothetical protein